MYIIYVYIYVCVCVFVCVFVSLCTGLLGVWIFELTIPMQTAVPKLYLYTSKIRCYHIINFTPSNIFQWNFICLFFLQENAFKHVVREKVAILTRVDVDEFWPTGQFSMQYRVVIEPDNQK